MYWILNIDIFTPAQVNSFVLVNMHCRHTPDFDIRHHICQVSILFGCLPFFELDTVTYTYSSEKNILFLFYPMLTLVLIHYGSTAGGCTRIWPVYIALWQIIEIRIYDYAYTVRNGYRAALRSTCRNCHKGVRLLNNLHGLRLSVRKQNVTASHAVLCLHRRAKQVDIFLMQNNN